MTILFTLALLQAAAPQEKPIEERIEAFLKGDAAAREELVKLGAYAIRPLQKARAKDPKKIDPLVYELKKAAAYPTPVRFDADFNAGMGGASKLIPQLMPALGRLGIPFFLDHVDSSRLKTVIVTFENMRTSLQLAEEICRQTGLDYGYFHNHIVLGMPERLWPSGPPAKRRELAGGELERAKALVEQLADDSIEKREAASRELFKLGFGVVPLLESQLKRTEAEIVARCSSILKQLRPPESAFGPSAASRQKLDDLAQGILRKAGLAKPDLKFERETLRNVAAFLKLHHSLNCDIRGGHAGKTVTIVMSGQSLLDFLSLMTQSIDLDFAFQGQGIIIDSREAIEKILSEKK